MQGGQIWGLDAGTPDWRTDLDYDGFDWGTAANPFAYGGVTYDTLLGLLERLAPRDERYTHLEGQLLCAVQRAWSCSHARSAAGDDPAGRMSCGRCRRPPRRRSTMTSPVRARTSGRTSTAQPLPQYGPRPPRSRRSPQGRSPQPWCRAHAWICAGRTSRIPRAGSGSSAPPAAQPFAVARDGRRQRRDLQRSHGHGWRASTPTGSPPTTRPDPPLYSNVASVTPSSGRTPFGGTAVALPGTVQAENFDEGGAWRRVCRHHRGQQRRAIPHDRRGHRQHDRHRRRLQRRADPSGGVAEVLRHGSQRGHVRPRRACRERRHRRAVPGRDR